ncbi:MAG: bifunctional phosphopantothenoylcysteine decarboxylase/phosphopantothenate--cysteine ligase CoaBC [Anaerolineae bacterium]|nr:bifunctional phosphopantothenoylcysteine decarboxylase/phosphopantothenate--cysteine ligase CoaBC [Anaerolineae bacterium]
MTPEPISLLHGKHIILGVTGSIAAYKAADLASKLTQAGALVDVIMTEAAQKFVAPLTFQAVTGRAVYTDLWGPPAGALPTHIAHVGLAEAADAFAIMPATADTLARLASGRADDLLAITALAARCPLLVAPAMDGGMYHHPATQANIETLVRRGVLLVEPEEGRFASGMIGKGRLPDPATLLGAIRYAVSRGGPLAGRMVVVTAGGTREPIDPVRYVSNRSSGKQGFALAQAALDAGADVTLITTTHQLPLPYGAAAVYVDTAAQLLERTLHHAEAAHALIMAAAVADFRPASPASHKIKKIGDSGAGLSLNMERTQDILMAVKARRAESSFPRIVVGFAAESDDLLQNARDKMARKGVDLLVANDITASDAGFETDTNRVLILDPAGGEERLELASKARVAEHIIERVAGLLN